MNHIFRDILYGGVWNKQICNGFPHGRLRDEDRQAEVGIDYLQLLARGLRPPSISSALTFPSKLKFLRHLRIVVCRLVIYGVEYRSSS